MLELGLKFTIAYLIGSVLGSSVMGWFRGGVDIRKMGSGNPGGTNALRTQGKWFALGVMVFDVGKGIAPVILLPKLVMFGIEVDPNVNRELLIYAVGFAAVLGHVYPIWFDFRGGKGGATAIGVVCILAPWLAIAIMILWLGIIGLIGYIGFATVSGVAVATVYLGMTKLPEDYPIFVFFLSLATLIIFAHRGNIFRMWNGTEPRFSWRQSGKRTEENS